ncbi:hypothetical protein EIN_341340 [Entamoeba invadens IP1]|uniref:Uncharacterized protein n=1 Tax=Entamoeba invadens IP1 TaxID=370355 RepID=A0A0A1UH60_ENTIV|nr:hypothetical protein EIN_341340 [Entamoeba invadens IP1]ELP94756.1 hypothetical protein EIN_341340 [Entamoeba invadens IP1]|eukprot:XP_004261527.1 hypothetical protein EIN_341340 [Entamoeba invadens IP1]
MKNTGMIIVTYPDKVVMSSLETFEEQARFKNAFSNTFAIKPEITQDEKVVYVPSKSGALFFPFITRDTPKKRVKEIPGEYFALGTDKTVIMKQLEDKWYIVIDINGFASIFNCNY